MFLSIVGLYWLCSPSLPMLAETFGLPSLGLSGCWLCRMYLPHDRCQPDASECLEALLPNVDLTGPCALGDYHVQCYEPCVRSGTSP